MYTRLLTFTGATDIDGGITYLREEAIPVINAQHGYRGVSASGDRTRRVLSILSLWDSEADRAASDSALGKARQEALKVVGGELTVENFEEVVSELAKPVKPGCSLVVTRVSMDPSTVRDNVDFFVNQVMPEIRSQSGFCAVRNLVDRSSGKAAVGTVWETRKAAENSIATQPQRRAAAEARGIRFEGAPELREILFVEVN